MTTPALEIKNLTKKYGRKVAVNDLSITIKKGEIFGFLGPNGAGKSTTINSICGIGNFDEGEILVEGFDVIKEELKAKANIGLSPQDYNVDMFLSPYQILMFCGGYYGIPHGIRKKRVLFLLKKFNLEAQKKKPFRELSGGMKRRVMLARALISDPNLLILDEPTAALDVELRYELWDLIRELNEHGKTIILTSHYIEEIEKLCEQVAIINHGKLLYFGPQKVLVDKYKSLEKAFMEMIKNDKV